MLLLYHILQPGHLFDHLFTFHYASTLSPIHHAYRFRLQHLHSTMLLLYRNRSRLNALDHLHLHSTMLLLYRCLGLLCQTWIVIYIPLCFYFISCSTILALIYSVFTFHYASTLSAARSFPAGGRCHLHSTMLLLYLETMKASKKDVILNLHSTMLLLYLQAGPICILLINIYIPLCFYFIVFKIYAPSPNVPIYIPLCFYFIVTCSTNCSVILFIYIPLCFYFICAHSQSV